MSMDTFWRGELLSLFSRRLIEDKEMSYNEAIRDVQKLLESNELNIQTLLNLLK